MSHFATIKQKPNQGALIVVPLFFHVCEIHSLFGEDSSECERDDMKIGVKVNAMLSVFGF